MDAQHHECIDLCWECRTTCLDTLTNHCLYKGGEHLNPLHVKVMLDCIDICQLAADSMRRRSPMHYTICKTCADICEVCAKICGQIGGERMRECAESCWRCAESCARCAAVCGGMNQQRQAA